MFVARLLWKRLNGYPVFYFERQVDAHLAWKDYGWEKTSELLGEMQQMVEDSGAELFKDWVHFNVEGNLIVAKEIANSLNHRLDLGICERPAPTDETLALGD